MIPSLQLEKRAKDLCDDIESAKVFFDGKEVEGAIKKKTLDKNIIKVFISISDHEGTITKVEIYDKDGDVVQTQDVEIVKNDHYKFLVVVEIRLENEVI